MAKQHMAYLYKKYGGEEGYRKEMGRRGKKGGAVKNPKKGFGTHPEMAREFADQNRTFPSGEEHRKRVSEGMKRWHERRRAAKRAEEESMTYEDL